MPTINIFLSFLAFFFGSVGIYLTLRAFFAAKIIFFNGASNYRKLITMGLIGVIFLFLLGVIIIYFYSLQPSSKRIIQENQNKKNYINELPDIS